MYDKNNVKWDSEDVFLKVVAYVIIPAIVVIGIINPFFYILLKGREMDNSTTELISVIGAVIAAGIVNAVMAFREMKHEKDILNDTAKILPSAKRTEEDVRYLKDEHNMSKESEKATRDAISELLQEKRVRDAINKDYGAQLPLASVMVTQIENLYAKIELQASKNRMLEKEIKSLREQNNNLEKQLRQERSEKIGKVRDNGYEPER